MSVDMQRRIFLKGSLAASAMGLAVGAGLLMPQAVLAAWPEKAFKAKKLSESMQALLGGDQVTESGDIALKVPTIAENGAVVPVKVQTGIDNIESITVFALNNPAPLVASFIFGEGAVGLISTRIKMGKTGDVVAVVKAGGKLHSARRTVKVTIGGCGG